MSSGRGSHQSDVRPEYLALGLLSGRSLHGYDLYARFEAELGGIWHMSQSQMYAILKRLEAQGLVEGQGEAGAPAEPGNARRSPRVLELTEAGRSRFEEWLFAPTDCSSRIMRLEFISRLYFARRDRPSLLPRLVAEQRAALERQVANHEALLGTLPPGDSFNRLGYQFRIRQLGGIIQWIDGEVAALLAGS